MSVISTNVLESISNQPENSKFVVFQQFPGKFLAEIYSRFFSKRFPFFEEFYSGFWAGFAAGFLVAPMEFTKVVIQKVQRGQFYSTIRTPSTWLNMAKSVLPFSLLFGAVCGLQFSVNNRIGLQYGKSFGVAASALTGSFFLTAADHCMFRKMCYQQSKTKSTNIGIFKELFKLRSNALWVGFTPMIARQAIFITSVMHLGPQLGKILHGSNEQSIVWNSIGRGITGVITTMISQPCDSLARAMQNDLWRTPQNNPSVLGSYNRLQAQYIQKRSKQYKNFHPLFKGALPRIGLATYGAILAGGLFDYFKNYINIKENTKQL